jgi:hypothetical protein
VLGSASGVQPDQLLKTELPSGDTESVIVVYDDVFVGFTTFATQPSGEPVVHARPPPDTVPPPPPDTEAVTGNVLGSNFATTIFGPFMYSVQDAGEPDTGQHPDQLLNDEVASGVAVSDTVS